jgi:hypothetical protein
MTKLEPRYYLKSHLRRVSKLSTRTSTSRNVGEEEIK